MVGTVLLKTRTIFNNRYLQNLLYDIEIIEVKNVSLL